MNPTLLQRFREKRAEWFSLYELSPEEPNAIQNQIHLMLLSEMSYRVALAEHRTGDSGLSKVPLLGHLLESGYFATQILAVSRLLDTTDRVHSVARVFHDLRRNKSLITREVYVTFDDTPYDASCPERIQPGFQPSHSPFSFFIKSRSRHERFDQLSKTQPGIRSLQDLIHPTVLRRLGNWLGQSGADNISKIRNKYLAHAADSSSRGGSTPTGLDFAEIELAQRAIVRVTRAIYDVILQSGVNSEVVPMVPLGFFGTVWSGNALIASTSRMQTKWDELAAARNSWAFGIAEELCG